MKVLQEMKLQQINGRKSDYQKTEFPILMQIIIDGLQDLLDHADLIQKYFIE